VSSRTKPLVILSGFLLVLPAALFLVLNLAVQLTAVQEYTRISISRALGTPVSIKSLSATILGGITAHDVSAFSEANSNRISIDKLTLYPDLLKLLQGKTAIREVRAYHPVVLSTLSLQGLEPQPSPHPVMVHSPGDAENFGTATPNPPPLPASSAEPAAPGSLKALESLQQLPHVVVKDAQITLLNDEHQPISVIQGMTFNARTDGDGWGGLVQARQVSIGKSILLHDLSSPFTLSPTTQKVTLNHLTAVLANGRVNGDFAITLPPASPGYTAQLNLSGGSLGQLFADALLGDPNTEGVITGEARITGVAGVASSMEGTASLLCTDAVIQPADFLRQIGQILQIQELQLLRISQGKILLSIHGGEPHLDNLYLQSQNLILTAQGPVRSNGDMDLQARLLFNQQLTSRLHGLLGQQLTQAPEPGYSQIAFHVSGPARTPKTDLLERLTGIHIGGDLGGFLQGIFGHPSQH
jgi:hypothetical protein